MSPSSSNLPATRDSIVGFTSSTAARSERRMGPRRDTVSSTDICVGVSPAPAVVGRSRREIRLIAARSRAASSPGGWAVLVIGRSSSESCLLDSNYTGDGPGVPLALCRLPKQPIPRGHDVAPVLADCREAGMPGRAIAGHGSAEALQALGEPDRDVAAERAAEPDGQPGQRPEVLAAGATETGIQEAEGG